MQHCEQYCVLQVVGFDGGLQESYLLIDALLLRAKDPLAPHLKLCKIIMPEI